MALRDQPYLPLYIQDIMTDEKLNECSAATHGIYIKGIMCLMHKSEAYGKILLKQKYKQDQNISLSFGNQLAKHLPYTADEIAHAISELLEEGVCHIEGDFLCQKRMIKDADKSFKRSKAGKKGVQKKKEFAKEFATAKQQANTEYENENENETKSNLLKEKFPKIELIEKVKNHDQWCMVKKRNIPVSDIDFDRMLEDWAGLNHLMRFDDDRHMFNSFGVYLKKNKPNEKGSSAMLERIQTDIDNADIDSLISDQ